MTLSVLFTVPSLIVDRNPHEHCAARRSPSRRAGRKTRGGSWFSMTMFEDSEL